MDPTVPLLAHVLETKILAMDAEASPSAANFEHIEERVDRFSVSLERLTRGEDIVEEPVEVPVAAVFEHQKDRSSLANAFDEFFPCAANPVAHEDRVATRSAKLYVVVVRRGRVDQLAQEVSDTRRICLF